MSAPDGSQERERLEQALGRGLARVRGLAGAWLFGSRAERRAHDESDVDVAVLLDEAHEAAPRLATLRAVIEALATEVNSALLHVVVLDRHVPPALAFRVVARGRPLAAPDPVRVHRFTVRAYREHGDREPVERFFREAAKERLARGGRG